MNNRVFGSVSRRRIKPEFILISIILAVLAAVLISNSRDISVDVKNSEIIISGFHGETISLSDLRRVDTLSALPKIDIRTNGYASDETKNGDFRLMDGTDVKLFVKTGFPPYLLLKTKSKGLIYINFEDQQKTRNLYKVLSDSKNRL
jgi:hypothetical protein